MATKDWKLEWKKVDYGIETKRYWNSKKSKHLQIGRYREADELDKALGKSYRWHGKYYVNHWHPEVTKLFKTKAQALKYAKSYMRGH